MKDRLITIAALGCAAWVVMGTLFFWLTRHMRMFGAVIVLVIAGNAHGVTFFQTNVAPPNAVEYWDGDSWEPMTFDNTNGGVSQYYYSPVGVDWYVRLFGSNEHVLNFDGDANPTPIYFHSGETPSTWVYTTTWVENTIQGYTTGPGGTGTDLDAEVLERVAIASEISALSTATLCGMFIFLLYVVGKGQKRAAAIAIVVGAGWLSSPAQAMVVGVTITNFHGGNYHTGSQWNTSYFGNTPTQNTMTAYLPMYSVGGEAWGYVKVPAGATPPNGTTAVANQMEVFCKLYVADGKLYLKVWTPEFTAYDGIARPTDPPQAEKNAATGSYWTSSATNSAELLQEMKGPNVSGTATGFHGLRVFHWDTRYDPLLGGTGGGSGGSGGSGGITGGNNAADGDTGQADDKIDEWNQRLTAVLPSSLSFGSSQYPAFVYDLGFNRDVLSVDVSATVPLEAFAGDAEYESWRTGVRVMLLLLATWLALMRVLHIFVKW